MSVSTCVGCGSEFIQKQPHSPGTYCSRPCGCRHRNAVRAANCETFDDKYRIDEKTGCWVWIRGTDKDKYGRYSIRVDGKCVEIRAHVFSYERTVGLVPSGMVIDHKCRNHSCVNPGHLEPVTNVENVRRGLNAKLTIGQVRAIRERYASGSIKQVDLANEFGVAASAIHKIVTGKAWVVDVQDPVLSFSQPLQWKRTALNVSNPAAASEKSTAPTACKNA